ncbi:hypothetical protein T10_5194 [Trichinella papuae]|uniref:Uncharacterized protein n=1 Tax=Trichinella papuae TaxID=268474 RepID=A0A0V1N3E5_9BILA|nr:hypothetical protein T10_4468 [Trichinella papuae]KRZ78474.1 hypothetical protein T10_5194 [Trichinella papuae]
MLINAGYTPGRGSVRGCAPYRIKWGPSKRATDNHRDKSHRGRPPTEHHASTPANCFRLLTTVFFLIITYHTVTVQLADDARYIPESTE